MRDEHSSRELFKQFMLYCFEEPLRYVDIYSYKLKRYIPLASMLLSSITYLSASYCSDAYFAAAAFFLPVPTLAITMRSDLTEYFFC